MDGDQISDPGKVWEGEAHNEDDLEEMEKALADEYVMECEGFKCPERYINNLTPMEFEEMVALFMEYDVDGSETIDVHEARKILHSMDMDHSLDKAESLLAIVDVDGSGEIDFEEFCTFIVLIKKGDSRLQGFDKLVSNITSTPLGAMEAQCRSRNLKFSFKTVEIREATSSQPPAHVVELALFGVWNSIEGGVAVSKIETRRVQGIGKNVREAKNSAASQAVVKLAAFMPGIKYEHGVIPDEWAKWIDENLLRGVQAESILNILVTKGFHPHKNIGIMQRIGGWLSFNRFLVDYPDFELDERHVNTELTLWITRILQRGLDGSVLWHILEDRMVELQLYHPHYAQRLRSNELGQILGIDGARPVLLDFWRACADGDEDLVRMYCCSGQDVNEEQLGRHDSVARTPIMQAAQGNHPACLRELFKTEKVEVRLSDRLGRTALHLGAEAGSKEACEVLMEFGARIFDCDHQGNTALHLAALKNNARTCDFLANMGQELTRSVTSDKVRPKAGVTFEELCMEVWEDTQSIKLHYSETRRFEKAWLGFASKLFCERMDANTQHMVAPTEHDDIVADVLARFDPRPETGMSIAQGLSREMVWIKTVPGGHELAILLKYVFRQTAIDITNNMQRTPLHLACEENVIDSHELAIFSLCDTNGCNVWLRDMHGRRAIDLLMRDSGLRVGPTSTIERERLLFERRQGNIDIIQGRFNNEDKQSAAASQHAIIDDCRIRSEEMSQQVWNAVREAAICTGKFGRWEEYSDPESKNVFFCRLPDYPLRGEKHDFFLWTRPHKDAMILVRRTQGLTFHRHQRSTLLRKIGKWVVYRCHVTNVVYYYDPAKGDISFEQPSEFVWRVQGRDSTLVRRLGYANEWEERQTQEGNLYYRNNASLENFCTWERPKDAVVVTPKEMFCSTVQSRAAVDQIYYSCAECLRAWKSKNDSAPSILRICQPCAFRCHKGHKGLMKFKEAVFSCACTQACGYNNCSCTAKNVSKEQQRVQALGYDERLEWKRQDFQNTLMPPIFANVPFCLPAAEIEELLSVKKYVSPKPFGGWTVCRRPPPRGLQTFGEDVVQDDTDTSSDESEPDDESSLQSSQQQSMDMDSEVKDSVGGSGGSGRRSREPKGPQFFFVPPAGLPRGWVEVVDPEEVDDLVISARVVVGIGEMESVSRYYGNITKQWGPPKFGIWEVRCDNGDVVLAHRKEIEALTRRTFFFNPDTYETAWTVEEATKEPMATADRFPFLTGVEWIKMRSQAVDRREYEEYDQMEHLPTKLLFYYNLMEWKTLRAALTIQKLIRQKMNYPLPTWWEVGEHCHALDIPADAEWEQRLLSGWCYLKRRSVYIGEFHDKNGDEWEEYTDHETAVFFYWNEETNMFTFEKPAVRTDDVFIGASRLLVVGDVVTFKFPGDSKESHAEVMVCRTDDETGEDMYDVVKKETEKEKQAKVRNKDTSTPMYVKWVPRVSLKKAVEGEDASKMERMEQQWRNNVRRQKEKVARMAKAARKAEIEQQMAAMAAMFSDGPEIPGERKTDNMLTPAELLAKARKRRGEIEQKDVQEAKDKEQAKRRAEGVKTLMEIEKKKRGEDGLTRSDVLALQRTIDMKLAIEDRIKVRNLMQEKLKIRLDTLKDRIVFMEDALRETESAMTTPRSLVRRRLIRRVHVAMKRQTDGFLVCEWGCGDWVRLGQEQLDHQLNKCPKRILPCAVGCDVKASEEDWLEMRFKESQESKDARRMAEMRGETYKAAGIEGNMSVQQYHEQHECIKRPVPCPMQCFEWVPADKLEYHMVELCTKRPAEALFCRLGCGAKFGGSVDALIESEEYRHLHEDEQCLERVVRCNWRMEDGTMCAAQMKANARDEHRDYHLLLLGVATFIVPGTYIYRVPKRVFKVKVQVWGAGGGSGFFKDRRAGNGGGGAFVEVILKVEPHDVLELVVGSGGCAGETGTEVATLHSRGEQGEAIVETVEGTTGTGLGGEPGGGDGFGGGECWGGGGGGGYSLISKRTIRGSQAIIAAGGGGGGGSLDGLPGGGLHGMLPGSRIDKRNGLTASCDEPGEAGDSGNKYNSAWPSEGGAMWKGGMASQFGGGGGSGYYGGGGGGTAPGIAGGGGGGSCYVFLPKSVDHVIIQGNGEHPGGLESDPPDAVGVGEWDLTGGPVGEGGHGELMKLNKGNNGCIRVLKPGYF